MKTSSPALAASAIAISLLLAGCSGSPATSASGGPTTLAVVASTNVYGDIAASVGGDLVQVTSIIDNPSKDPHEYEADAQNQLAISRATLVIENGGGYDDFMETLLDSSGNDDVTVVNVADLSGYDQEPSEGEFNEHMWYDVPTVSELVDTLVAEFSRADPSNAASYTSNGDDVKAELSDLEAQEDELKATYAGEGVAITEPVPLYVLDAIGLKNLTPGEFSEAIEEDTDVPPAALAETLDLFSSGRVKLLAYNAQTVGPQTEDVLAAAEQNDVAVVPVTETLPEGKTYIQWMKENLDAISAALAG